MKTVVENIFCPWCRSSNCYEDCMDKSDLIIDNRINWNEVCPHCFQNKNEGNIVCWNCHDNLNTDYFMEYLDSCKCGCNPNEDERKKECNFFNINFGKNI